MKNLFLSLFLLTSAFGFSQNETGYRYVEVPNKFLFQNSENQFNLNELTKFLIEKRGFITFLESEIKPTDFKLDECGNLKLNVEKEKTFIHTKLKITITDCTGKVIAESRGESKEKKHHVAYNLALRDAFDFLTIPKRVVGIKLDQKNTESKIELITKEAGTLYAQKTNQGFILFDHENTEKFKLFKTSKSDQFIISNSEINGALYKSGNNWILEYLKDNNVITEVLKIKF